MTVCRNRLVVVGDIANIEFPDMRGFDALGARDLRTHSSSDRLIWTFGTDDVPAIPLAAAFAENHPSLRVDLYFARGSEMGGWSSFRAGALAERHEAFTPEAVARLLTSFPESDLGD